MTNTISSRSSWRSRCAIGGTDLSIASCLGIGLTNWLAGYAKAAAGNSMTVTKVCSGTVGAHGCVYDIVAPANITSVDLDPAGCVAVYQIQGNTLHLMLTGRLGSPIGSRFSCSKRVVIHY